MGALKKFLVGVTVTEVFFLGIGFEEEAAFHYVAFAG